MKVLQLLARDVHEHFSAETLRRSRSYADALEEREVHDLRPDRVVASAMVWGTSRSPYRVTLRAVAYGDFISLSTTCSCPVHQQCKHGAALALGLARDLGGPTPPVTWEHQLGRLVDDLASLVTPLTDPVPVALQLSWGEAHRRYGYSEGVRLRLRPMRPGKRHGWIKSGIGWEKVAELQLQGRHDPQQMEVLMALANALERYGNGYWYPGRETGVEEFGPQVVPLLREARDLGMELLLDGFGSIDLADKPAALAADASAQPDGTRIVVGVDVQGELWSGEPVRLLGDPAHSVLLVDGPAMTLAQLNRRLPRQAMTAAKHPPLLIPTDAGDRATGELLRLRRAVPIESRDGSVELPATVAPRLRLTVTWSTASSATRLWSWVYGETAVGLDDDAPIRDIAAERDVLVRLPAPLERERREVSGADVLHLALLELPAWRACDVVDVVEIGAPDFRESGEGPEISFDLVPGDDESHTDWLDLEVTITVEGERVMLVQVLAALTLGHEHLVLPSGLFVRTDRPEFSRLDDVVRAAAELRDPDGDRVSVGRHDLGLWAQLAELGVVDEQAAEWVSRAQALRDLVELPRPEPTGVVSTLRPYQVDGFHWLAFLWQHGLGGVLADDMGLGKTLQVLALVAHTRTQGDRAPFLVVAPTSVVGAWVAEAERHTPGLRVRTIDATAVRRDQTVAAIAADADIVVTSYTLHRLETEAYEDVEWGGLVLDEAHFVKNHQSKAYSSVRRMRAPFRLAVTGTPFENRLMEYWALLSIAAPGIYPHPRSFTDNVVRPVEKQGDEKALRRFTGRIKPFVLRRTKELVADDLPPKVEQVLEVELAPKHRKLYDTHLAKERQRILGLVDDFDRNRVAILAALTKLRQLALDPALVDDRHDKVGSAKVDVLVEHLLEVAAEGHRALVFSTFTGFLTRVRQRLDAEGIATSYLDGRTKNRAALIEDFRSGDQSAFLISLKAGGVGLTLTEADYVFVLDPWWNPAAEAQAVDRAHRIGQHKTVMVYRMVSTGTIEDKVMALKARKAELFRKVIDGDGAASQAISAEDIRALFD